MTIFTFTASLNYFKLQLPRTAFIPDIYPYVHTGKCIRRFGGIYAYCRYFIDTYVIMEDEDDAG